MPYNDLSASLADATIETIKTKLEEIQELLPFLISLSAAERKALPKISSASAFFVKEALNAAQDDPAFMPPYVSVPELGKDLALFEQLQKITTPLAALAGSVSDTSTAAGSEAYVAALSYYNSVKRATKDGAPGAQVIYERLRKRFEGGGEEPPTPPKP